MSCDFTYTTWNVFLKNRVVITVVITVAFYMYVNVPHCNKIFDNSEILSNNFGSNFKSTFSYFAIYILLYINFVYISPIWKAYFDIWCYPAQHKLEDIKIKSAGSIIRELKIEILICICYTKLIFLYNFPTETSSLFLSVTKMEMLWPWKWRHRSGAIWISNSLYMVSYSISKTV